MRSIRFSLLVYFLGLLVLALGAVSAFAYWTTAENVAERTRTARESIEKDYQARCREERSKLDDALLYQARMVAGLVQSQSHKDRLRYLGLLPLGMLSAGLNPNGYALMPVWLAEGTRGALAYHIYRAAASEIQLAEEDLPEYVEGAEEQYFQINQEWGGFWRSQSMGTDFFPFDPEQFARTRVFEWAFDDIELRPGLLVRRVTLKAPGSRYRVFWLPGPLSRPEVGFRPHRPPGPPNWVPPSRLAVPRGQPPVNYAEGAAATIVVHCACDTTARDAALASLLAERDRKLAQLASDSAAQLSSLRQQLFGVGLATWAATVAGGFWLVRVGLAPLRRLSDAVSQVSEKDFRLPFDEPRLPGELRPIVERLEQTLDLLRRAFTREKQAAADISHELRTPLAALLTTTEVALRKPRSPDEYRELLGDCRSLGQQMSLLVERLLALARLDAGVDTMRAQPVDVAVLAGQCVDLVRPLAEARDLQLKVRCPAHVPLVADPDKLREVITNLLHNAIEYNRPQGSVSLEVERENGHLRLEVRDTGIGIAPEAQARIFERFYRADPSREATGLHAGLGLAIVKGYVDLMGGSIAVDSAVGQGSTFRVKLPAGDDKVTR
jgi:heavy metal sensor kinase